MSEQNSNSQGVGYPLVSIVTPTYNQAAFLRDTLDSVLAQDYPNIEHDVIDDGSTDETPQILAKYSGRLRWESHENRAQTVTINKGWERAHGDILTWLNSDDTLLPGAIAKAVEYLKDHPDVGIVFGDTLFTNPDGSPINRSKPRPEFSYHDFVIKCENPIPQPSSFIRRLVIEDTGPLDPVFTTSWTGIFSARGCETQDCLYSRTILDISAARRVEDGGPGSQSSARTSISVRKIFLARGSTGRDT